MKNPQRLLVAVDFSPGSEAALDSAISLARSYGATLHIAHAFDLPVPLFNPYAVAVPVAYVDEARKAAEARLAAVAEKARAEGLAVETHLGEVPAAPTLVRIAEEVGADLIVIGTRGLTGVKHALLGSVAERTVRTAPCSVLTVKDDDRDGESGEGG